MKRFFKQYQAWVIILLFAIFGLFFLWGCVHANAESETQAVYVTASELNGREEPDMSASIEAHFYRGDELEAIGYKCGWVEVYGGETGTVWCKAEHLTECSVDADYVNTSGGRVFIHAELGDDSKSPSHAVESRKRVTFTRVLYGYGYMGKGWVEMRFFEQEGDAE